VLVKPQSPVLFDDRVSWFRWGLCSCRVSYFPSVLIYMFLASYIEMLTIHFSRFPTLVVVAQELKNEEENANGSTSSLSNSEVILSEGAYPITGKISWIVTGLVFGLFFTFHILYLLFDVFIWASFFITVIMVVFTLILMDLILPFFLEDSVNKKFCL